MQMFSQAEAYTEHIYTHKDTYRITHDNLDTGKGQQNLAYVPHTPIPQTSVKAESHTCANICTFHSHRFTPQVQMMPMCISHARLSLPHFGVTVVLVPAYTHWVPPYTHTSQPPLCTEQRHVVTRQPPPTLSSGICIHIPMGMALLPALALFNSEERVFRALGGLQSWGAVPGPSTQSGGMGRKSIANHSQS